MRLWVGDKHLTEEASESLKKWFDNRSTEPFTFEEIQTILSAGKYNIEINEEIGRIIYENMPIVLSRTYYLMKYNEILNSWEEFAPLYSDKNGVVYEIYTNRRDDEKMKDKFRNVKVELNYDTVEKSKEDAIYIETLGRYEGVEEDIAITVEEANWLSDKLKEYVREFESNPKYKLNKLIRDMDESGEVDTEEVKRHLKEVLELIN